MAGTPAPRARRSAPLWSSSARYGKSATVASPSARSISRSGRYPSRHSARAPAAFRRGRAGQGVVRGEEGGGGGPQEPAVELARREPLEVEDVGRPAREP